MPYRSKKQQRWAHATHQTFARRWDRLTNFSHLPESKDAGTNAGAPAHGPGGLLATPGLGKGRKAARWRMRVKDSGYSARAGQVIRGNLARGGDGKFTSAGNASAATPKRGVTLSRQPKPHTIVPKHTPAGRGGKKGGGKGRAAAKPKLTPEQRKLQHQQERAAEQAKNRDAVASALADADASIGPSGVKAVLAAADGGPIDAKTGAELEKLGYAQKNPDGSYRLSPEAHALANAAKRGDTRAALDADGRAQERAKKEAEAAAKKLAPKKGGGGGGKAKPSPDQKQQQQAQDRAKRASATAAQVGLSVGTLADLRTAAETGGVSNPALAKLGFLDANGQTSDQGRRALTALERGDVRGYQAAVQDAKARMQREQDAAQRRAQTDQKRTQHERERKAAEQRKLNTLRQRVQAGSKLSQGDWEQLMNAGQAEIVNGGYRLKAASTLAVFKDHTGAYRWLARTTTAYRDRDKEILSSDALDRDSARMTALKQFGPLRYWHLGDPDPYDADQPWGRGLDLGDCDYSVLIGRTRVESGTFRDPVIAQKVAADADQYEMSPGFFHPESEPDSDKVYNVIRTFERSLVPKHRARAANLFTGFTVKESRMKPDEMERRFKAAIEDLGLDREQALALAGGLIQTEKTASQERVAFKTEAEVEAPQIQQTIYYGPDNQPGIIQDGAWIALKAAAPIEETVETETQAADDMPADDAELAPDDAGDGEEVIGNMTVPEFWAQLQQYLNDTFMPQQKMADMLKAMGDMHGELKSMYSTKEAGESAEAIALKEQQAAELATLKEQQAQLAARIAEIEGHQPATILPAELEAAFKSEGPQAPADPENPSVVSTPERPMAGAAASIMPELYYGSNGWQPKPAN
jgi:hypothetical protein